MKKSRPRRIFPDPVKDPDGFIAQGGALEREFWDLHQEIKGILDKRRSENLAGRFVLSRVRAEVKRASEAYLLDDDLICALKHQDRALRLLRKNTT
jgi:hypothetical protein